VDASGSTGITLFDFNQDNVAELIYRDESDLRIMKANGSTFSDIRTYAAKSGTGLEHPVVADVDNDGQSAIVTVGGTGANATQGTMRIYKSGTNTKWAPARKVWNQYAYNSVNVNEDLTIPRYPLNPATFFPNGKQPFNNFLQQQTPLNINGDPLWLTPDAVFNMSSCSAVRADDSVSVTVCFENIGDAPLGNPAYIAFYRDTITAANFIKADSVVGLIFPGGDTCKTTKVGVLPNKFVKLIVRLNDKGFVGLTPTYPVQLECHYNDSVYTPINPALSLYMKKNASLRSVEHNGTYSNPVAVLYGDSIKYEIKAWNANMHDNGKLIIRDTLPAYLDTIGNIRPYVVPLDSVTLVAGTPYRKALHWSYGNIPKYGDYTVTYHATPQSGSAASQPLFVNHAWIQASDTLRVRTDTATYHQGAGIAVVTFSAGIGGSIYNHDPQAVDYSTSVRSCLLIVPDEGYKFVGWSHPEYYSMRGDVIPAASGIMNYDTLLIYGHVELRATFEHLIKDDVANAIVVAPSLQAAPLIWASGKELLVNIPEVHGETAKQSNLLRIYTADGVLYKQQTILTTGLTKIKLPPAVYIVTLNNGVGVKVGIN
jgi:hypothetical protein